MLENSLDHLRKVVDGLLALWPVFAAVCVLAVALTLYLRSRKRILFESWVNMADTKDSDLGKRVGDLLLFNFGRIKSIHERSLRALDSWDAYQDVPAFMHGLDEDIKLLGSVELGKYASAVSSFLMILFQLVPIVFRPARLRGSIHQYGNELHLLASLEDYGFSARERRSSRRWKVIQCPYSPERMPDAVEELAYRIFIDLTGEGLFKSWEAFKKYTEGLASYTAFLDLQREADFNAARACYEEGLIIEKQNPGLQYNLGQLAYYRYTLPDNEKAIDHFTKALNCSRARLRSQVYSGLANALLQRYHRFNVRDPQYLLDAKEYAQQAFEWDPNLDTVNKALAFACHQLSEHLSTHSEASMTTDVQKTREDAIRYYQRAYKLNRRHYVAHNNLSNLYLNWAHESRADNKRRLIERAIKESQAALDINPQFHFAEDNLANGYRQLARSTQNQREQNALFAKAEDHYRRALRIKPEYAEAKNDLASLFLEPQFVRLSASEALKHHCEALGDVPSSESERAGKLCSAFFADWSTGGFDNDRKASDAYHRMIEGSQCSCPFAFRAVTNRGMPATSAS